MIPSISALRAVSISGRCSGSGLALDAARRRSSRTTVCDSRPMTPGRAAVVGGHRQVERQHAVAEDPLADRDRLVEVGPVLVELGDHDRARHADGRALLPQHLGRAVDAVDRADHEERGVGGAQAGPQVADEVGVARGVEQVDLDPRVHQGRQRQRDRALLSLLGLVEVADGGARPPPVRRGGWCRWRTRSASTRDVFPAPEWPTSTTLRTDPGWSAAGAAPAAPALLVWTISTASATSSSTPCASARAHLKPAAFTREPPSHKGPTGLA